MFTWRYFAFLCAVVAWSLANYLLFLVRWTGDGASEPSLNRTLDASGSGAGFDLDSNDGRHGGGHSPQHPHAAPQAADCEGHGLSAQVGLTIYFTSNCVALHLWLCYNAPLIVLQCTSNCVTMHL